MRFRRYLLVLIPLAAACLIVPLFYGKLAVALFAAAHDMDVSYKKMHTQGAGTFLFDNMVITDRKTGMGLSAEKARIDLAVMWPDIRRTATRFDINDGRFLTKTGGKGGSYDNLDSLVAAPFNSEWKYSRISGGVYSEPGGITVKDLTAGSGEIRVLLNGRMSKDSTVSSDITIYFHDKLIGKMPPELTNVVLKNEDESWKSLSVHLEGDYTAPSIKV